MLKNKTLLSIIALFISLHVPVVQSADTPAPASSGSTSSSTSMGSDCVNARILSEKIFNDVCWDCVFPITLAGLKIGSGKKPSGGTEDNNPICKCYDRNQVPIFGLVTAMWEPARLIEFQRTPGCSSVLNGVKLPTVNKLQRGHLANNEHVEGGQKTALHYHYFAFPLLDMLKLFSTTTCQREGMMELDMLFMSEIDPTWYDDKLALFTSPEAIAVANLPALVACSAESISATVSKENIQNLFWCAGSWGSMYPLSGTYYAPKDTLTNTSLLTAKVLARLHRMGLALTTMGREALCEKTYSSNMLPKEMYKFTLMHPRAEKQKAHIIGESALKWGGGRVIPGVGEDLVYIVWRWNECCLARY